MSLSLSLITFYLDVDKDTKVCGEAGTQPSQRLPPLRDGRHAKLFAAALSLRQDGGTMLPGDGFLILDGGREGILSLLFLLILMIIGVQCHMTVNTINTHVRSA